MALNLLCLCIVSLFKFMFMPTLHIKLLLLPLKFSSTRLLAFISAVSITFACTAQATTSLANIENAYFHRDYLFVQTTINAMPSPLSEQTAALAMAAKVKLNPDHGETIINNFIKAHPNNAYGHYYGGLLWSELAKNAGLFSRMGFYKKSVTSMITAGLLAPDNPRFQVEAAKAYGQPAMLGGQSELQKPIVDKLQTHPSIFAELALMDYLQNTEDKAAALQLIAQLTPRYDQNVELLERMGQLLWTFEQQDRASDLFSQACQLTPPNNQGYVKWLSACQLTAAFALNDIGSVQHGLDACKTLLKYDTVNDSEHHYFLLLNSQLLAKNQQYAEAKTGYQKLLALNPDKNIKKEAMQQLKKL